MAMPLFYVIFNKYWWCFMNKDLEGFSTFTAGLLAASDTHAGEAVFFFFPAMATGEGQATRGSSGFSVSLFFYCSRSAASFRK